MQRICLVFAKQNQAFYTIVYCKQVKSAAWIEKWHCKNHIHVHPTLYTLYVCQLSIIAQRSLLTFVRCTLLSSVRWNIPLFYKNEWKKFRGKTSLLICSHEFGEKIGYKSVESRMGNILFLRYSIKWWKIEL